MNEPFRNEADPGHSGAEPTAVLPETAAQLVEMERLQQALAQAEERAKNHWEQYLRAVADVENVRKRAQKDIEAAHRYGIDKLAAELLPFDPAKHEAMLAQPSTTAEPNSVLQVVQRGYELNGRLLRPARVIVAKAP